MSGAGINEWKEELKRMAATDPSRDVMEKMMNTASPISAATIRTPNGFIGSPRSGMSVDEYVEAAMRTVEGDV